MNDRQPISRDAYTALEAEIQRLENEDRPAIAAKISAAREDGDLKENAEYHAAKNDQSFLETRILLLREQLQNSEIVESTGSSSEVSFGSTVRVVNLANEKEATYTIVSSFEQDISQGKLSNSSPVAEALIGASNGETVKANLPNGSAVEFKILEIS